MLLYLECHLEHTIVEESQQGVLCIRITSKQIEGLCEHWFTNEEWSFEPRDVLDHPAVMSFRSVEKSNERPGINDGRHRGQSP